MLRVTADRAHHQRLPAALRVEHPAQASVVRTVLDARGKSALDVLDLDEPDRAERALGDELPRVPGHRIRGIRMRDREETLAATHACGEVAGFSASLRDRLVADHVETGFERRSREAVVRVVRRHDRDRLDTVGATTFALEHFLDAAVTALALESHRGPRSARARGIAREHSGDGAPPAVHLSRPAVHPTDPGVRATANDCKPQ